MYFLKMTPSDRQYLLNNRCVSSYNESVASAACMKLHLTYYRLTSKRAEVGFHMWGAQHVQGSGSDWKYNTCVELVEHLPVYSWLVTTTFIKHSSCHVWLGSNDSSCKNMIVYIVGSLHCNEPAFNKWRIDGHAFKMCFDANSLANGAQRSSCKSDAACIQLKAVNISVWQFGNMLRLI